MFEGSEKVLLELEVRELVDFEETHGELSKGIKSEKYNADIRMTTNLLNEIKLLEM
jgi:hypothetical protein